MSEKQKEIKIEKRVECGYCGFISSNIRSLRKHTALKHDGATAKVARELDPDVSIRCPLCSASCKPFNNEKGYAVHMKLKHGEDVSKKAAAQVASDLKKQSAETIAPIVVPPLIKKRKSQQEAVAAAAATVSSTKTAIEPKEKKAKIKRVFDAELAAALSKYSGKPDAKVHEWMTLLARFDVETVRDVKTVGEQWIAANLTESPVLAGALRQIGGS